jgi:hypothetical protein
LWLLENSEETVNLTQADVGLPTLSMSATPPASLPASGPGATGASPTTPPAVPGASFSEFMLNI